MGPVSEPPLRDEVSTLVAGLRKIEPDVRVAPSTTILNLPGVGLSVPDLVFERKGRRVYFELLGYWSREAAFRRVDLVRAGMRDPVLFALDAKLRVSEEILSPEESAALYVFKGSMRPQAVLERIDALAVR